MLISLLSYRKVISDITKEMGFGMAKYLEAQVVTLEDWNEYCHYVAGVVGEGLSRLFAESGLEGSYLEYYNIIIYIAYMHFLKE